MMPPVKLPSRYRCLRGMAFAIVCLALAALLTFVDDAHCDAARKVMVSCEHVPEFLVPLFLIAAAFGVLHTAYRAYRDFWAGDYLWDLKRGGHI